MSSELVTDQRWEPNEFCGVREAMRISGFGSTRLLRLALLGDVEARLVPGRAPLYRRRDIERAMSRSRSKSR